MNQNIKEIFVTHRQMGKTFATNQILPNIIDNLQNKLIECELKYGDRTRTIILIDIEFKDYFIEILKDKLSSITRENYYRSGTKNIMAEFGGVPVDFVDNISERLIGIFNEYDKILILRHKEFFELFEKKDFENFLKTKNLINFLKTNLWNL